MERSYLVHRLSAPRGGRYNPYSFGAGLPLGGFTEEGMETIRGVFEFSPMGSAQYEFGAPQKAMEGMWEDRTQMVSFALKASAMGEKREVYVTCRQADQEEVTKRVKAWARWGGRGHQYRTRDSVSLDWALREATKGKPEDYSTRGWLELDNGFFFTVDEQMAKGFERLMGMGVEKESMEVGAA